MCLARKRAAKAAQKTQRSQEGQEGQEGQESQESQESQEPGTVRTADTSAPVGRAAVPKVSPTAPMPLRERLLELLSAAPSDPQQLAAACACPPDRVAVDTR